MTRTNDHHRTRFKPLKRTYTLGGIIFCGHCGRRLGGETRKSRAGSETSRYVCKLRDHYPGQHEHPVKVTIAESTIAPLLEEWVAEELSASRLDVRAEQLAAGTFEGRSRPALDELADRQRRSRAKINRLYELMKDPDYPIDIAKTAVQQEKAALASIEAQIAATRGDTAPAWTVDDYRAALHQGLGDIPGLLEVATDEEKQQIYRLIGIQLTYTRTGPGTGDLVGVIRPRCPSVGWCAVSEGGLVHLRYALPSSTPAPRPPS